MDALDLRWAEVEQLEKEVQRSFKIDYKHGLFEALTPDDDGIYAAQEAARGLQQLLLQCKNAGLTHLNGVTNEAVDHIHELLVKTKPVLEFVESLWDGESSASRTIGFHPPERE